MGIDYLIRGATVFDGDSPEPQQVDVGVQGNKIAYVGPRLTASAADKVIDGQDLYLCPGFIDTHASTGLGYTFPHAGDNKLHQGVTTEIIGNCGTSSGPVGELLIATMENLATQIGFEFNWQTLGEWFDRVAAYGLPFNVGTFVGHSTLRGGVCTHYQAITDVEIQQMRGMLMRGLAEGALGMSTGLVYTPGSFATTEEIVTLAEVVAQYKGVYASHIRDERQALEAAIDEAIGIGEVTGCSVLISHLKAAEKSNWGKIPGVIRQIEAARARGVTVNYEVYPYTAVSTKLRTFIPKDSLDEGVPGMVAKLKTDEWRQKSVQWLNGRGTDFANMILITDEYPEARGRSVLDVAAARGQTPADQVVDILLAAPETWIVYHCMDQADVDAAVLWPDAIICSDSWSYPVNAPKQIADPHPRTYGAFTRFLEQYVVQSERLSWGQAVRKITSLPADWLGLTGRGRIRVGGYADLVLLDPTKVREMATYERPRQFSQGTAYVWVNGTMVLANGVLDATLLPGQFIRRQING